MKDQDSHLSDQLLLLDLEGELPPAENEAVQAHLKACWKCRVRRGELDKALASLTGVHLRQFESKLPPTGDARMELQAELSRRTVEPGRHFALPRWSVAAVAGAFALLVLALVLGRSGTEWLGRWHPREAIVSSPDSRLTPGATLLVNRGAVCSQVNIKNKDVPPALQRAVFAEYGIAGADPHAYEVDYLVTPALGGSDDIHNLWPHSYSATVWNAQVKDALEDRLRDMVCAGQLDLADAQREIAGNWIAAYKKYFRTDHPMAEHTGRK